MNTSPLTILPVLNCTIDSDRSRSQHLRQASAIAKVLDPSTSKLTLDVAKRIWATYSSGDSTDKTVETEVAWNTNALGLHLGIEGYTTVSDMTLHEPFTDGDSPASEHDVEELLPAVDDAMKSPQSDVQPLPPNNNSIHFSDLHNHRSQTSIHPDLTQPHMLSSVDRSQHSSRPDPLDDMRGALMNSFQKAVHLRYPHVNVDVDKLRENFASKLTDAEVQDFMRMGRAVVEDLKRSGKIHEAKRKLAMQEQDDESEARRNRRCIDTSPSRVLVDAPNSTDHVNISRHTDFSSVGGTPVASTTLSMGQNEGPSMDPATEGSSTPICSSTQQDTPWPSHLNENISMSVSPSHQRPPGSPHSRPSSLHSNSGHQKNNSAPPYTFIESTLISGKQLHSHEPPEEGAMKTDDTMDFRTPRVLLAKVGQPTADVSEVSFDINERLFNAVRRWAQYWKEFDPSELHMRLYLTSIPTTAAENANRELPPYASTSRFAESVARIHVVWPPSRTFYVSLNRECPEGMSWGDDFFGASSSPLDISNCVVSGKNTIRFIQLEDLSQRLFLILAMPPSESEKRIRVTWKKQLAQHMVSDSIKVHFKP